MTEQKVSSRYANAILDIAEQESLTNEVIRDFELLQSMLDSSKELVTFTVSPVIADWQKKKIYEELISSKVHKLTMNFILLLINKGRIDLLPSIIIQFGNLYNLHNNRVKAIIKSASELTETVKSKIMLKLTEITGKVILPEYKTDKSIKGGLSIQINDWVYDATLKTQLELLRKQLSGNI